MQLQITSSSHIERMLQLLIQRIELADERVAMLFGRAMIGAVLLDERLIVLLEHSMRLCDRSSNSGERNQWSTRFSLTHDRFEAPKIFNKKAPVASLRRGSIHFVARLSLDPGKVMTVPSFFGFGLAA